MVDISNPDWSVTDGSNTQAPPNGFPVGMASNQVRPTAQQMMGGIKRWWERSGPALSTTGSAGAYVYTPTNATYPSVLVQGDIYVAKANFTSVGADTLNVNSLGALPLYKPSASGPVVLAAGDIVSGQVFVCAYDSALNGGGGGFQVTAGIVPSGSVQTLNQQVFTSNGTFTIPSSATSATIFKFTAVGGGGGGGGSASLGSMYAVAGSGGSGGVISGLFSGFPPSGTVTIALGAAGTAGSASAGNGGSGGTTTVTYSATAILTATGGAGGHGSSNSNVVAIGAAGSGSATAGTLNLLSSLVGMATAGSFGYPGTAGIGGASGLGGSNPYGAGGAPAINVGGNNGGLGAGGSGAVSISPNSFAGGAGGKGIVIVEWVL